MGARGVIIKVGGIRVGRREGADVVANGVACGPVFNVGIILEIWEGLAVVFSVGRDEEGLAEGF